MKERDRVKIVSIPLINNNEYGQLLIKSSLGKKGTIDKVYLNGERNIVVNIDYGNYQYFSESNLELIPIPFIK